MCGRYLFSDEKDIEEIYKILRTLNEKYRNEENGSDAPISAAEAVSIKTGEIFPTDAAPVLSAANGKMELELMRWGFPKWDGKGTIINARSETAAEKKMFAKSLQEQRCVILSTGFFEWKREGAKARDKYLFTAPNSPMLYMAGLYTTFHAPENRTTGSMPPSDGAEQNKRLQNGAVQKQKRFVILTCGANRYISDIHDRMPVIMRKHELKDWLRDDAFAASVLQRDGAALERALQSASR